MRVQPKSQNVETLQAWATATSAKVTKDILQHVWQEMQTIDRIKTEVQMVLTVMCPAF